MFTGIIEEIGEITAIAPAGDGWRLTVRAPRAAADAVHGESIAVSGVCLTVVASTADTFDADVMKQTLDVAALGGAAIGTRVNIEKAMPVGARLGGHIVQGHVDGVGEVLEVRPGAQWSVLRISLPDDLAPLVVDKGSISVDGTSLTVSAVSAPSTGSGTQGTGSRTQGTGSGTQGTGSRTQGTSSGTQGTGSGIQGTGSETRGTGPGTQGTGPGTQGTGSETQGTGSETRGTGSETGATGSGTAHWFEISLIPETLAATTLGARAVGDRVNLETDILARHVERLLAFRAADAAEHPAPEGGSR